MQASRRPSEEEITGAKRRCKSRVEQRESGSRVENEMKQTRKNVSKDVPQRGVDAEDARKSVRDKQRCGPNRKQHPKRLQTDKNGLGMNGQPRLSGNLGSEKEKDKYPRRRDT